MKKLILSGAIIGILLAATSYYILAVQSNIIGNTPLEIKIRKGDTWGDVHVQLTETGQIRMPNLLNPVVQLLKYDRYIKPGRYVLEPGMSTLSMIRKLRSGAQTPVNLTLNNITFLHQLAGRVSAQLDIDSTALAQQLYNAETAASFGFNKENFATMFVCNTYSMFWDTDIEGFLQRMQKESERFWNDDRKNSARSLGLQPDEVIILASIVQKETNHRPEYSRVAGVYLNRINRGMALQADPTVKFALGDMSIRRILKKDLSVDSPYNTYVNTGLPPGPICLPDINVIDAVLKAEKHQYLYFCAEYGSGKHAFAVTYSDHLRNAAAYQRALNQEEIYR